MACALTAALCGAVPSHAQYYELASQLPSLISPALSGSMRYKGYADAGFTGGFTDNKANFMSFSTSQGFQYSDWFFMGAGIGVDVTFRNNDLRTDIPEERRNYHTTSTGVMMPVFTDFRFILGGPQAAANFFIDLKIGATFLLGNNYMEFSNGYLTNNADIPIDNIQQQPHMVWREHIDAEFYRGDSRIRVVIKPFTACRLYASGRGRRSHIRL